MNQTNLTKGGRRGKEAVLPVLSDLSCHCAAEYSVSGTLPEAEHLIPVIDTAIAVHTTNVMRHAGGRNAEICIAERENCYILRFTNDGSPPQCAVAETGGLSEESSEDTSSGAYLRCA